MSQRVESSLRENSPRELSSGSGFSWNRILNAEKPAELVPHTKRFDTDHNIEQVVVQDPASGLYEVEVIASPYGSHPLNQFNAQPYPLVFVGSGPEVPFS